MNWSQVRQLPHGTPISLAHPIPWPEYKSTTTLPAGLRGRFWGIARRHEPNARTQDGCVQVLRVLAVDPVPGLFRENDFFLSPPGYWDLNRTITTGDTTSYEIITPVTVHKDDIEGLESYALCHGLALPGAPIEAILSAICSNTLAITFGHAFNTQAGNPTTRQALP